MVVPTAIYLTVLCWQRLRITTWTIGSKRRPFRPRILNKTQLTRSLESTTVLDVCCPALKCWPSWLSVCLNTETAARAHKDHRDHKDQRGIKVKKEIKV